MTKTSYEKKTQNITIEQKNTWEQRTDITGKEKSRELDLKC